MSKHEIEITVNGKKRNLLVNANDLLLNVIRDDLHLIGAKYGCGIGECGACTVWLEGKPILACMMLAVSAHGKSITTVEGLAKGNKLTVVQQAFIDHGAIQCGFCTPGMVMMAEALLKVNPSPTEEEIREHFQGNYCRCTGYVAIVRAVKVAAKELNQRNY